MKKIIFTFLFLFVYSFVSAQTNLSVQLSGLKKIVDSDHIEPKKIDDHFSSNLFDVFVKSMDPSFIYFTASDLKSLEKYRFILDDEINNSKPVSSHIQNIEPFSNRFSERTITQACSLLLREAGKPLHVNDLYNFLVTGGMEFKGNNPTISIAVSLNRNRRFRKVAPGTFDLVMRDASQAVS